MTDLENIRMRVDRRRVNFCDSISKRSNHDDLKQLEAAIRDAYVAKELKAQKLESEATRVAEEAQERLKNEILKRGIQEAEKINEEEKKKEKLAQISYGVELKTAIKSKIEDKASALEKKRRERRILEKVSEFIEQKYEADKISDKLESAQRTFRQLQIFEEIKEIRFQKEADHVEEKRKRDLEYVEEIDARIKALEKSRKEHKIARENVVEIVSKSLIESREKKLKIEIIIADLIAEEKLYEEELKLRKYEEMNKIAREEAAAEIERHRIIIEERKLRDDLRDEEFAVEVMKKVLEDRRIDRLTIEAKRRRQIEYRKSLEEIIRERKSRRELEMIKLEEYLRLERQRSEDLRKRVKEIRKKLIVEHAGNVAQFIARGALSDEEKIILDRIIDGLVADKREEINN